MKMKHAILAFALISAGCNDGQILLKESGEDTGIEDTATPVEDCPMEDPWVLGPEMDVVYAWYLLGFDEFQWLTDFTNVIFEDLAEEDCPSFSTTAEGHWQIFGDCSTSEGWTFAGSMEMAGSDGGLSQIFENFSLSNLEEAASTFIGIDGKLQASGSDSGGTITLDLDLQRVSTHVLFSDELQGHFVRKGTFSWFESGMEVDMAVNAIEVPGIGKSGEYCVEGRFEDTLTCEEEADGRLDFIGSVPAAMIANGSEECDECFLIEIDGEDAGTFCTSDAS